MIRDIMSTPIFRRATQDEIIEAFASRLETAIRDLGRSTVVISDQPIPEEMPTGGFVISVSPGAGEFPHAIWANGHHATATEDGSIIVGIYRQSLKDRLGQKKSVLISRAPGTPSLMGWKHRIIKALSVADETNILGKPNTWEPIIDGHSVLRDIPQPVRATAVRDVPDHPGWIGLQVTFSCTWDWDLYQ